MSGSIPVPFPLVLPSRGNRTCLQMVPNIPGEQNRVLPLLAPASLKAIILDQPHEASDHNPTPDPELTFSTFCAFSLNFAELPQQLIL